MTTVGQCLACDENSVCSIPVRLNTLSDDPIKAWSRYQGVSDSRSKHTVAVGADSLSLPSGSVLRVMRIAHARFLSDTTQCPMVASESVCRRAVPDSGSGSLQHR